MMMMHRVMCVLAVVLCYACGYTMTAADTTVNAGQPKAVTAVFDDIFASIPDDGVKEIVEDLTRKNPPGKDDNTVSTSETRPAQGEAARPPEAAGPAQETDTDATTEQNQSQGSTAASPGEQGSSGNTADSTTTNENTGVKQPSTEGTTANNSNGEYLVVTFEPITQATYDKYCKDHPNAVINGKNCSELLKYLEAKAKLPPSPPKESKDAEGHSNESGTGSHSGIGGVAAGNGEPQAAEVVQGSTGTEGNAITATPEGS
ncbi:uncharacterized protein TM35_000521100, partial [Trypanosoma theileri]